MKTLTIPIKLFTVRQPNMRRKNRLCALHVGVAGQNNIEIIIATTHKRRLKINQSPIYPVNRFTNPKSEIGNNLIIPASRRMQFSPNIADHFNQSVFDVHVNIFKFNIERKLVVFDSSPDFKKSFLDLMKFLRSENSNITKHSGVSDGTANVHRVKATVNTDTFGKQLDSAVCPFSENSTPCFRFFL
jgi:hypothetical protein